MDAGSILGLIAGLVAPPLIFFLLRRMFPLVENERSPERPVEELANEYRKYELTSLPILFAVVPLMTYFGWRLIVSWRAPAFYVAGDGTYSMSTLPLAFVVPVLFAAIAATIPICDVTNRLRLKDRYAEYLEYENRKNGFNGARASTFALIGSWLASLGMLFLLFNWYFVFAPNQIRANRLFSLTESRYSYDDITAINSAPRFVAPNGKTRNRDVYSVRFSDGKSWFSNLSPCSSSFDSFTPMVEEISVRSGVKITRLPLMTKSDQ